MSKKNVEWEWKKLGDVSNIYNGNSINEKIKKECYSNIDEGFPFIATKDVSFDYRVDYENGIRIPYSETHFKTASKDTVLICAEGGSAGRKKCILNQTVCFGNKLFAIDSNKALLSGKFVFYYVHHDYFLIEFKKLMAGIIGGVSSAKFKEIPIPIPPLDEQERIVKVLDDAFEKIDAIKTTAETNLQNAKDLFQTTLDKIIDEECIQYERIALKEITTKIGSGATPKGGQKSYQARGISLIRSLNVHHGLFSYDDLAHINETQAKALDGVTIQKNDVLFNITGASIARCCVVPDDVIPARVNQHVSILRPNKDLLYSKYLSVIMLAPQNQKILIGVGEAGATRQALTKADLESFQISLPPLSIQKQIVAKLDSLSEKVKQLESNYKQVLADCDELKKAILKQAFEGML